MENIDIFQQLWFARSNYNSKAIFNFYGKLDPLSFGELRVASPAQIAEHRTSYIERDNLGRKKEMPQDRILTYFRVNVTLTVRLVLLHNS